MSRDCSVILKVATHLALLLMGCTEQPSAQPMNVPKAPKIGVVLPMFKHPFFIAMKTAIEEEAKRLKVEVDIRDGQDDDQKQIVQVQALLGTGINALVLCPR